MNDVLLCVQFETYNGNDFTLAMNGKTIKY